MHLKSYSEFKNKRNCQKSLISQIFIWFCLLMGLVLVFPSHNIAFFPTRIMSIGPYIYSNKSGTEKSMMGRKYEYERWNISQKPILPNSNQSTFRYTKDKIWAEENYRNEIRYLLTFLIIHLLDLTFYISATLFKNGNGTNK